MDKYHFEGPNGSVLTMGITADGAWYIDRWNATLECPIGGLHTTPTPTTQEPPMTGTKPIVLPVAASAVTEYESTAEARAAAERFCAKDDNEYVVYVPVLRVRPKKDLVVEEIPPAGA